jgi:hypothetical protein
MNHAMKMIAIKKKKIITLTFFDYFIHLQQNKRRQSIIKAEHESKKIFTDG